MDKPTLIHKVLSGNGDEAEKAELNAWISSDPAHAEEFEDIRLLHESSLNIEQRIMERDDKFYDGLRRIQDRIKTLKRRRKKAILYKIAGIVTLVSTLIIIVSVFLFNLNKPSKLISAPPNKISSTTISGIQLYDNLRLEDATLESILKLLKNKYHLIFQVRSREILSCRFTGMFSRGITIDEMIRVLSQSENFSYTVVNSKTYELHGKGCP